MQGLKGILYTKAKKMKTFTPQEVRKLLKEQRELCAQAYSPYMLEEEAADEIRNAPEPKLPRAEADHLQQDFHHKELNAAWEEWVQYRKEKGQSLKPTTTKKQVKFIHTMTPALAVLSIEQSMLNGWTGLFYPKQSEIEKMQTQTTQGVTIKEMPNE